MASPQLENGYTRIANEILENLIKYEFPKNTGSIPYRLCIFIIRKTYGYNKKEDRISLTQFEEALGVSRPAVSYWLKYLVTANLLVVNKTPSKDGYKYSFNKDYDNWLLLVNPLLLVTARKFTSKHATTATSKLASTHKRKKETITKDTPGSKNSTEIPTLIKAFEGVNPACSKFYGNPVQRRACEDLIKSYGFDRVLIVIEKTLPRTNGLQYFPSITTPLQLNDKWASLESAVLRHQSKEIKNKTNIAFC